MLSVENFKELFPRCEDPDGWVDAMNEVLSRVPTKIYIG